MMRLMITGPLEAVHAEAAASRKTGALTIVGQFYEAAACEELILGDALRAKHYAWQALAFQREALWRAADHV